MKKVINKMSRFWYQKSFGLLLIRFATGSIFFAHGWQKIHNVAMVSGMLGHMGVVAPDLFGPFIAWLEVVGGICLILGVLTRPFGVAFGIEMIFAIFLTGVGRGWSAHELEMILMLNSFALALLGSGRFSLFAMECEACGGMLCSDDCPKPHPKRT